MRLELYLFVTFVAACIVGYVLVTNKVDTSNENKENAKGDSFVISKMNQILLTFKDIMKQTRQDSKAPEDIQYIYKVHILHTYPTKCETSIALQYDCAILCLRPFETKPFCYNNL